MTVRAGTTSDDTLIGSSGEDILAGLEGNDRLFGGRGNDVLAGGLGRDRLIGGGGDDLLIIDAQDRIVNGGAGTDVAILHGSGRSFLLGDGFRGVEGVQDIPGADTTVTMDAEALENINGDDFLFALGDGTDSVRIIGGDPDDFRQEGDTLVWNDEVTLSFEGVEQVSLISTEDGRSKVITFNDDPATTRSGDFAGPGSPAGKTAAALGLDRDVDVNQRADITQVADVLGGKGDIDQTAEIIQKALGRGDISQIADILQDARAANGDIDQRAAIDQIAKTTGGDVTQVGTVVQDAVTLSLGDVTQEAGIDQGARAGRGGTVDQSASIDQQASARGGGSIDQSASVQQSASATGGGSAHQQASVSQSATVGAEDDHGLTQTSDGSGDFLYAT